MKLRGRLLKGRGKAMFCTYHKNCGALPEHRILYRYPSYNVSFDVCAKGAKERGQR
jgi:hypothetical protein